MAPAAGARPRPDLPERGVRRRARSTTPSRGPSRSSRRMPRSTTQYSAGSGVGVELGLPLSHQGAHRGHGQRVVHEPGRHGDGLREHSPSALPRPAPAGLGDQGRLVVRRHHGAPGLRVRDPGREEPRVLPLRRAELRLREGGRGDPAQLSASRTRSTRSPSRASIRARSATAPSGSTSAAEPTTAWQAVRAWAPRRRFTTASAKLVPAEGPTIDIDAGGFQVAVGVRVSF